MTQFSSTISSLSPVASSVQPPTAIRRLSTSSSIRTLSDISVAASFASSGVSVPLIQDEEVDYVREEGLRHAEINLEAR
jgi:hypothetical protein